MFVSQLAVQVYTVLDKTMIGVITHSEFENGYYDQAQKVVKALTAVVTSIGAVMASRIAFVWHSDNDKRSNEIQELLLLSFRLVFALSFPIAFGILVIASRFVPVFFGEGYEPVIGMLQLLAWIVPLIGCSNIIGIQLFIPSGREQLTTRSVFLGAAVNVAFNSILIPRIGALGAVAASVIAEFAVTFVQVVLARRELPLRKILRLFIRYLLLSCFMAGAGYLVSRGAAADLMGVLMILLSCAGIYGVGLLVIRDPVLKFFFGK